MEIHTQREKEMGPWTNLLHPPTLPPTFYLLPHLPNLVFENKSFSISTHPMHIPLPQTKTPIYVPSSCTLLLSLRSPDAMPSFTFRHCHLKHIFCRDSHVSCHGSFCRAELEAQVGALASFLQMLQMIAEQPEELRI